MIPVRTVEDLLAIGHAYQKSMILFVGLRLGVFPALSEGPLDAPAVGGRVGADPRRVAILLDALTAMGLLVKKGGAYRNAKIAQECLVDGPASKGSILLHHLDGWTEWTNLERKIRGGRKGKSFPAGSYQENFIRGMEENARERAAAVAKSIPLRPGERVLDLGGGPGTYAVAWAKRYRGTEVTIFDVPETLRVTRAILSEKGADGLVRLREGDFLKDAIGGPYDFIWISHILHAYGEKDCVFLLRKARRALARGGRVAVQEFLLGDGKTGPPGPAFFSVHMLAVTDGGRAYTAREIARMFREAGYRKVAAGRPDRRGVGVVSAYGGTGPLNP